MHPACKKKKLFIYLFYSIAESYRVPFIITSRQIVINLSFCNLKDLDRFSVFKYQAQRSYYRLLCTSERPNHFII